MLSLPYPSITEKGNSLLFRHHSGPAFQSQLLAADIHLAPRHYRRDCRVSSLNRAVATGPSKAQKGTFYYFGLQIKKQQHRRTIYVLRKQKGSGGLALSPRTQGKPGKAFLQAETDYERGPTDTQAAAAAAQRASWMRAE